jgi:hypothetical protein
MAASIRMNLTHLAAQGRGDWTCGVISATRLLIDYGVTGVDVNRMKTEIGQLELLGHKVDIGNTTDRIVEKMRAHHPGSTHDAFITFDFLRKLLAERKPVAVLLYLGEHQHTGLGVDIPMLHWLVVAGFDDGTQRLRVYDPAKTGASTMSYAELLVRWCWKDWTHVRADAWGDMGLAEAIRFNIYGAIDDILGRNSAFWIDEPRPKVVVAERDLSTYRGGGQERYLPSTVIEVNGTGVSDCNLVRAIHEMESKGADHFGTPKEHLRIALKQLQTSYTDKHERRWSWNCWRCRSCRFSAEAMVHDCTP